MTDLQSVALAVWLRRLNCYVSYHTPKNELRKGLFKNFFLFFDGRRPKTSREPRLVGGNGAHLLAHRVDDARGQKRTQRRFLAGARDFFD